MYPGFTITPLMTSAMFEAFVREMPRIQALKALENAEISMIPHISNFARKEWFRKLSRALMPRYDTNKVISFNGRVVGMKQLKTQLNRVAKKAFAQVVGD